MEVDDPIAEAVQELGLKTPGPSVVKIIWPVGALGAVALVSAIVTVHVVGLPTTTGFGMQIRLGSVSSGKVLWVTKAP